LFYKPLAKEPSVAGSHSTPPLVVRERFSWWPHLGAGLAAFLVTGLTVHFFAQHGLQQATKSHSFPVQVRVEVPDGLLAGIRETNASGAIQDPAIYFRRPELLRQAWQEFTSGGEGFPDNASTEPLGSCEQFTSSLRVKATKTGEGYCIDLRLDSPRPGEAAEYLKTLARLFVRQRQSELALSAGHRASHARKELLQAETEYRDAEGRMNRFEEEQLRQESGNRIVDRAAAEEVHRQFQREVEEADAKCLRKREALEIAESPLRDLPPQAIQVVLPAKAEPRTRGDLLGLSLSSGLAMAVGVCFISLGSALEPLVARLADLERLMTAPILGIVPRRELDSPAGRRGRRRGICRWTLLLGGLLLIGGATASILMVVYQYTVS
jgi:hypothetical protein